MHAEGKIFRLFLVGPSFITVTPHKPYKYPLVVNPLLGGIYTGSITFYESTDKVL